MLSERITKMDFVFVNTSAEQKVSRKDTEGTESKDFNSYLKTKESSDTNQNSKTEKVNSKETKFAEYKRLVKDDTDTKTEETDVTDQIEQINPEVYAQVIESIKQIMGIIQETFGMTETDIKNAMSDLGMKNSDLLTKTGLNELLSKLVPEGNTSSLLTNSEFSNAVKEMYSIIGDLKETLKTNFSMSDEDINSLLQKLNENSIQTENDSAEFTGNLVKTTTAENTESQLIKTETESAYQTEKTDNSQSKGNSGNESSSENLSQGLMNKISEALEQSGNSDIDAVKIIKQIVNEIKLTVKQDMTKFEMQLNPEHLGKVGLQVISKDGIITAQIAASNAAVKEAIENQIVVLKQNLEEQGIKVDSIEVTIASHGFEHNNEREEEDLRGNSSKKSSVPVRLGEITDEEADNALEEQLLQQKGSTVSYSA